jgi:hypothetical protein
MQTDFRAIVHSEYGAPEKVLKIAERQLKSEALGADDVLVKVIARPIHPGDIQILSALPQGGPVAPIPEGTLILQREFTLIDSVASADACDARDKPRDSSVGDT